MYNNNIKLCNVYNTMYYLHVHCVYYNYSCCEFGFFSHRFVIIFTYNNLYLDIIKIIFSLYALRNNLL